MRQHPPRLVGGLHAAHPRRKSYQFLLKSVRAYLVSIVLCFIALQRWFLSCFVLQVKCKTLYQRKDYNSLYRKIPFIRGSGTEPAVSQRCTCNDCILPVAVAIAGFGFSPGPSQFDSSFGLACAPTAPAARGIHDANISIALHPPGWFFSGPQVFLEDQVQMP